MNAKQECNLFLSEHFNSRTLKKPLFFNAQFGLRFDLQEGETGTEDYFKEVIKRSTALFEAVFKPNDDLLIIFVDYKWKRRKIRFQNYCFSQINNLRNEGISYSKAKNRYETDDAYNIAFLKLQTNRTNYRNILTAIANTDFAPRVPRFRFMSDVEIYFVNIKKRIIFHMYDDRGLDIVASDIETLKPIYLNYNNWILKANRKQIDDLIQRD